MSSGQYKVQLSDQQGPSGGGMAASTARAISSFLNGPCCFGIKRYVFTAGVIALGVIILSVALPLSLGGSSSASSTSSSSTISFESVPCTYAEGCAEGFCKVDYNHEGMCEVCPAIGEMCDPTLTTYTDFSNCCKSCPDAICDNDAWKNNWTSYSDTLDIVPDVGLVTSRKLLVSTEKLDFWTNYVDLVRRDTAGVKGCLGYKMYGIQNSTQNWENVGYWESIEAFLEYSYWRAATFYSTPSVTVEGSEVVSTGFYPVVLGKLSKF